MKFSIYRYDPDKDAKPYMKEYELADEQAGPMIRDALMKLKEQDETLSFRHSCGEGVCGSDAINVNGSNQLGCQTPVAQYEGKTIEIRPVPGLPVIRDLVVDMSQFYNNYREVKPYIINDDPEPEIERLQSPADRDKLDGLYECIMCGCCSTSCPSFWWNPDKYLGPQALLQSWRFLADSRDQATDERLDALEGAYKLFRCHTIMNCVEACPKNLSPTKAIGHIKQLMVKRGL